MEKAINSVAKKAIGSVTKSNKQYGKEAISSMEKSNKQYGKKQ